MVYTYILQMPDTIGYFRILESIFSKLFHKHGKHFVKLLPVALRVGNRLLLGRRCTHSLLNADTQKFRSKHIQVKACHAMSSGHRVRWSIIIKLRLPVSWYSARDLAPVCSFCCHSPCLRSWTNWGHFTWVSGLASMQMYAAFPTTCVNETQFPHNELFYWNRHTPPVDEP